MVPAHSPLAREDAQHALVLVIPVAARYARALSREGRARGAARRGGRRPATTTQGPLHIGVTVRPLNDDPPSTPPSPLSKRSSKGVPSRASRLEPLLLPPQPAWNVMPGESPSKPRRQRPQGGPTGVAGEWGAHEAQRPTPPCHRCSSCSSSCSSISSGAELSITLVARNSPRRHSGKKHGDPPSAESTHARACKCSRCGSSARRLPEAAGRAAGTTALDDPQDDPRAHRHHDCFLPQEKAAYRRRAQEALEELARKAYDPPKAAGDCYSEPVIHVKVKPKDVKETHEKFCVTQCGQHIKSNISDIRGRRNETKEPTGIKNECVGNIISDETRGKVEGKRVIYRSSFNNEDQAKKVECLTERPLRLKHTVCPRDTSPAIMCILDPPLSPMKLRHGCARFVDKVTKSEEDLLKEISKISKPVVLLRHIDSSSRKSNQLTNKERTAIDPEIKVIKRVDSFTQTSEDSVDSERGNRKSTADYELSDLPADDQGKTSAADDFTTNKGMGTKKFPKESVRPLLNSSKFKSSSSSESSQRTNFDGVRDLENCEKTNTQQEAPRRRKSSAESMLTSPALGRPRRPSGVFVSAMAREFEQMGFEKEKSRNADHFDDGSYSRACKERPLSNPRSRGDRTRPFDGPSCVTGLSPEGKTTPSRSKVERLPATSDAEDEVNEGGEQSDAWEEPPLPPLPARSKSLSPTKSCVCPQTNFLAPLS